jgi:hypothetical protein
MKEKLTITQGKLYPQLMLHHPSPSIMEPKIPNILLSLLASFNLSLSTVICPSVSPPEPAPQREQERPLSCLWLQKGHLMFTSSVYDYSPLHNTNVDPQLLVSSPKPADVKLLTEA